MKNLILSVLMLLLVGCTKSALFTVNSLARFGDYSLTADISYGPYKATRLDIYTPNIPVKGTVIFFYGGCWGACSTYNKASYRFVAETLTKQGLITVIPDYRLYPDVLFDSIMQDAVTAVRWVNENISDYGALDQDIILMGHSAGGHIAAMLTTNESYLGEPLHSTINSFIGLAGPYDFLFDQPYQFKLFSPLSYEQSQPSYFVDGSEPPMLLLYGNNDTSVHIRNINNMTEKIRNQGGRVEPIIYNEMNHSEIVAAFSIPLRSDYSVVSDINQFLNKITSDEIMNPQ